MAAIHFTENLRAHLDCPPAEVDGATVAEVLSRYVETNPTVRRYVLDEQGMLRKHIVIFVDGEMVRDRRALTDPVGARSDVYVMQALSGG